MLIRLMKPFWIQGCSGIRMFASSKPQVSMLGLQQNSFILSAAVSACDSHARWEQAACVLRTAVQEGLHVNPVVYNSVVSACASGIQWSGALHVLNSVQQAASLQAALQAGSNAAVEALGRSLLWPRALRCLRCLRLARQEANIVGQSSAITGCARAAAWACGLLLWQAMQAASAARFSDTSPTLNAVVTAASQGVWQLAVSFLQSPGDVREPLADAPTYGAALRACVGDAGAGDVALSLFERMRVQQVDPDEAAWSAVIAAARDDLQAGGKCKGQMQMQSSSGSVLVAVAGCRSNTHVCDTLSSSCSLRSRFDFRRLLA